MRRALALAVVALAAAPPALAGAWLREERELFVALSTTLRERAGRSLLEVDLYADYGWSETMSLGLSAFEQEGLAGHAYVFGRLPLGRRDGPRRLAMEFGIGAWHALDDWAPLARVGLAYGQGWSLFGRDGWLGAEAALEHRGGLGAPLVKVDAVAGQSSPARLRPMVKVSTTYLSGADLVWSVSGHVLIDGPGDTVWNLGIEVKEDGARSEALILGLWRRF